MKHFINKLFLETIEKTFHGFGFGVGMSLAFNKFKGNDFKRKIEGK